MKWTASCFYGPNLAPFCLFWSFSQRNDKYSTTVDYKWKKRRWCAWNSSLGLQDCRHRRIHWAMVKRLLFIVEIIHKVSGPGIQTRDHLIRQPAPESWNFWGCSLCIFHHLWSPPIKNKNRLSSFTIRSLKIYSLHRLTNHDGRASAFLTWEQGPMLWNTFCLNSFWTLKIGT